MLGGACHWQGVNGKMMFPVREGADDVQELLNIHKLQLSEVSSIVPLHHKLNYLLFSLPEK